MSETGQGRVEEAHRLLEHGSPVSDELRREVEKVALRTPTRNQLATRAMACEVMGCIRCRQGETEQAQEEMGNARIYFREAGDRSGEARVLAQLAELSRIRGRLGPLGRC